MTGRIDVQQYDLGKALFERLVDLWNGEVDFVRAEEFIAEDFIVHSAQIARFLGRPDSTQVTSRQELLEWISATRAMLHDLHFTTGPGPIRDGDFVAGGYTATAVYAGGAPRANAAPGTELRYTGISIVRMENDKLAEYWVLSDALGLLSQLEAVPTS
ncbi:MAG: ester cyclase [Pseudonocardiaceae bacterium]